MLLNKETETKSNLFPSSPSIAWYDSLDLVKKKKKENMVGNWIYKCYEVATEIEQVGSVMESKGNHVCIHQILPFQAGGDTRSIFLVGYSWLEYFFLADTLILKTK